MPLFHSKNKPIERITKKPKNTKVIVIELLKDTPDKTGNKRSTSTSKTKKIMATRKNRKENGERLSSVVENPHSKGLLISRSNMFF